MIRDSVLAWGSVALVIILAFILIPTYERFKDAQGREVDVDPNAPPMPEWLKSIDPRTGVREGLDTPVTTTQLPPGNVTVSSSTPSGSKAMASQSMPNNSMLGTVGSNLGLDTKTITNTLPPPRFSSSGPAGLSQGEDKYVLKSSLQPCACGMAGASAVPGGNDGAQSSLYAPDGVRKPFSAAFGDQNEPEGYLTSFSAFMK